MFKRKKLNHKKELFLLLQEKGIKRLIAEEFMTLLETQEFRNIVKELINDLELNMNQIEEDAERYKNESANFDENGNKSTEVQNRNEVNETNEKKIISEEETDSDMSNTLSGNEYIKGEEPQNGKKEKDLEKNNELIKNEKEKIVIPNGMQNHFYEHSFNDDIEEGNVELIDLDKINGLEFDSTSYHLKGVPEVFGSYSFTVKTVTKTLEIVLYINPDPKTMWKDVPSKQNIKKDNEYFSKVLADRLVIAASRRGNSHANDGTPKDDHFLIREHEEWICSIVADGAGSASHSHIGSKVACEAIAGNLTEGISNQMNDFEELIKQKDEKLLKHFLYDLYGNAVIFALNELKKVAEKKEIKLNDLHTTALITLTKKFNNYTFTSGFQIGDGISGVFNDENSSLKVLGEPDVGEQAGQTYFLTSGRILESAKDLMKRIKVAYYDKDAVIISMTDGITDPFFSKTACDEIEEWKKLWNDLSPKLNPGVNGINNLGKALLEWSGFYKPGYHDDRTIVLIF